VFSYPVGVSVGCNQSKNQWSCLIKQTSFQCFPTPLPRAKFQQALDIQKIYNRLYCSIAEDEQWIHDVIRDIIPVEPLAAALWSIYEAAKETGYLQNISVGIFRSDYMLRLNDGVEPRAPDAMFETSLKQVEMNTFSASGGSHANKVGNMHRYLAQTGIYNLKETSLDISSLPKNENIESLASCLALAHATYGKPRSQEARQTAVLMIVQPNNVSTTNQSIPISYHFAVPGIAQVVR
jgi:hypothetical protein